MIVARKVSQVLIEFRTIWFVFRAILQFAFGARSFRFAFGARSFLGLLWV